MCSNSGLQRARSRRTPQPFAVQSKGGVFCTPTELRQYESSLLSTVVDPLLARAVHSDAPLTSFLCAKLALLEIKHVES